MARPFPQDQVEHELRSLRRHFMGYSMCPPIVRIKAREATFARPSMDVALVTSSPVDDERYGLTVRRSVSVLWWSSEEADAEAEAFQAADWITKALMKGGPQRSSLIPIYDWSSGNAVATTHFMDTDAESIDARPLPDEYGSWMMALDFRYTSRVDWPLEPAPAVTTIKGVVGVPGYPAKITIP